MIYLEISKPTKGNNLAVYFKDNCSSLSPTFKIRYNPTKEPIVKVTNFFKKCLSPIIRQHSVSCYITYETNGLEVLKEPKPYVEPL